MTHIPVAFPVHCGELSLQEDSLPVMLHTRMDLPGQDMGRVKEKTAQD